jgi:AraC-like DNA-binding protein
MPDRVWADADQVIFDKKIKQLRLVGADPYLNEMLLDHCKQALAYRRARADPLRITIENAISPLLPHGKARLDAVAQTLGVSKRTLARRLSAEGLNLVRSSINSVRISPRVISLSPTCRSLR